MKKKSIDCISNVIMNFTKPQIYLPPHIDLFDLFWNIQDLLFNEFEKECNLNT